MADEPVNTRSADAREPSADGGGTVPAVRACDPRSASRSHLLAFAVLGAAALAPPVAWFAHRTWGLVLSASGWALLWPLLMAPVVEEWLFRSLQAEATRWLVRAAGRRPASRMGRRPEVVAAILATAIFVIAHASVAAPALLLAWTAPGAALAAAWTWRRRLADCIALHAWFNVCLWAAEFAGTPA